MTHDLTTKQMTIFNRVMKSSFYYPIAACRNEPQTSYPTDVIQPGAATTFYTEYFTDLNELCDVEAECIGYVMSDSLSEFTEKVSSAIKQLSSSQTTVLLDEVDDFAKKEQAHFIKHGVTVEENYSIFHSSKMVSQLLRYQAAYSWMGYFKTA